MGIITLKGLKFHAFHGVYEEEQKNGNTFIVDVKIDTDLTLSSNSDNLADTIDYVEVYNAVKGEMEIPSKLLEHIAQRINTRLIGFIKNAEIETIVYKMNPPLGGDCLYSSVSCTIIK